MSQKDPTTIKKEPNIDTCRTTSAPVRTRGVTTSLFYCTAFDVECKDARLFGYDCLCQHADKALFERDEPVD